jgi:hypothetical protein
VDWAELSLALAVQESDFLRTGHKSIDTETLSMAHAAQYYEIGSASIVEKAQSSMAAEST